MVINNKQLYKITLTREQLMLISRCVEDISRYAAGDMDLQHTTETLIDDMDRTESLGIRSFIANNSMAIRRRLFPDLEDYEHIGYDGGSKDMINRKRLIDNVIFRETMDYDERAMRNHDKMAYLKENKVYLNDIWKCIDKDNRFTPIKQLLGYYYYVEVYKYQNIDMVSESANLVKLYEQKQIANDVVFEMIFHPNGNLNGSWVDDEDILLAYNPYKS